MKRGVCGRRAENSKYVRADFICCLTVKFCSGCRFDEINNSVHCLHGIDSRSFQFDLGTPQITHHVSDVEIV